MRSLQKYTVKTEVSRGRSGMTLAKQKKKNYTGAKGVAGLVSVNKIFTHLRTLAYTLLELCTIVNKLFTQKTRNQSLC